VDIIQIVSRLPPAVDGVGDYAFLLARQLRAAHGINSIFVVCNPQWKFTNDAAGTKDGGPPGSDQSPVTKTEIDGFPVFPVGEPSETALVRTLSLAAMPGIVLLQYVGYGYQRRGCPVWLARGLSLWRKSPSLGSAPCLTRCLLTMFHELYAFGPVWSSSFWTSPLQRWIAKSLAKTSDICFTNRNVSADWLAAASQHPRNSLSVLPVVSNLGEPKSPPSLASRRPQMVIYGGVSRLPKFSTTAKEAIQTACNRLGIKRIVTFGSKRVAPLGGEITVENLGIISAPKISALLLDSRAGYLDYFDGYLAKSGIFAAFCSHGLAPLLLHRNHSESDGLRRGQNFWALTELPENVGAEAQQKLASQAFEWYNCHSVITTAACFATRLEAECRPC